MPGSCAAVTGASRPCGCCSDYSMWLVCLQVTYGVGSAVVNVFARIDAWLESTHWFTTLVPPAIPPEVWDPSTGSMKGECRQVSMMPRDSTCKSPGCCHTSHCCDCAPWRSSSQQQSLQRAVQGWFARSKQHHCTRAALLACGATVKFRPQIGTTCTNDIILCRSATSSRS